ncbi:MAG TPA: hypothetical protein VGR35_10305 [Tepidisphaeraceae bacterium]|nr:hypothetical protein [Tepidisphaeraceae bacterium]
MDLRACSSMFAVALLTVSMLGCASSADPRLADFRQRETQFGRADWIVLPNDQGGEVWVAPAEVEEEVRGMNRNDPPELRLDYSTQQRQVWLYTRDAAQVRFEPNSEPQRAPMEPHFVQRHKQTQAAAAKAKADAERVMRNAQQQLNPKRQQ